MKIFVKNFYSEFCHNLKWEKLSILHNVFFLDILNNDE